jgi:ribosome maturation factor RimP
LGVKVEIREEVRQIALPLAEESGFELVDVEATHQGRHRVIRVLLDKLGGITVGDCAKFSRRLSDCLDMNQTVPGSYQLEVSSPGIERPITSLEAVERFRGRRCQLKTLAAHDGQRNFEGELLGVEGSRAGLRTDDGAQHWFDWQDVRSAHLVVDPWARSRESRVPRVPGASSRGPKDESGRVGRTGGGTE